ncbi:unnamed protein product [Paramecium octaurelia]|uniref:Uncharacterized protein n=1 Tax=Paramecium octaurelia TaxID=43137 RepID=A0A8S1WL97_PAROT|nr:unnamed protein product [Paramecium octaurelia]
MDKMDKCCLLGAHNSILYINCIVDLYIPYIWNSIIFSRHRYFQLKLFLNLYQKKLKQQNFKFRLVLKIMQNLKSQFKKEYHHKIQLSMDKQLGNCKHMYIKMILWQIENFEMTIYPIPILLVEGFVQVIKFAVVSIVSIEGNKKPPEEIGAYNPVIVVNCQLQHNLQQWGCHQEFEISSKGNRKQIIEIVINKQQNLLSKKQKIIEMKISYNYETKNKDK